MLHDLPTGTGNVQWYAVCRACGHRSPAVPFRTVKTWVAQQLITPDRILFARTNTPTEQQPCAVLGCAADTTELHHFAPVNTFGWLEAETWPKAYLCRPHHHSWHRRMDGYAWHRKGIAS